MKKIIIGPLLLLSVLFAMGQEYNLNNSDLIKDSNSYQRILSPDSTVWDVAAWDMPGVFMAKIIVRHQPDSAHHPVYFYSDFHTYGEYEYFGKIREDTVHGRLWLTEPSGTDEILIMDMSLNLADTFQIDPENWTKVDSIYIENGTKIIRFELVSHLWNEKVKFIEGVGPNVSVLYWYFGVGNPYVSCMHVNNNLVFQTDSQFFEGCTLNTVSVKNENEQNGYNIFPNPTNSELTITVDPVLVAESKLKLFDIAGKLVVQKHLTDQVNKIDISFLFPGIYTVFIHNDNTIFKGKIIVVK